jgi:hypothetical protein
MQFVIGSLAAASRKLLLARFLPSLLRPGICHAFIGEKCVNMCAV